MKFSKLSNLIFFFSTLSSLGLRAEILFRTSVPPLENGVPAKTDTPPSSPTLTPYRFAKTKVKFYSFVLTRKVTGAEMNQQFLCEADIDVPVFKVSDHDWETGFGFQNGFATCDSKLEKAGAVSLRAYVWITEGKSEPAALFPTKNFSVSVTGSAVNSGDSDRFYAGTTASTKDFHSDFLKLSTGGFELYSEKTPDLHYSEEVIGAIEFTDTP